jgi:2-polyprenyl-3-methyl-5-hydroxy-6-metoxy-1,4-benzoquinol methylase
MSENAVESYGWTSNRHPGSCGIITPQVAKILKSLHVSKVLDLGCGNGALCSELAQIGYTVVGVEYDRAGVRIAQQVNPNLSFYNYGVQDDPAELMRFEQRFDVVVSTEVVEHLYSPHLLPSYARGVLKSGGYLVISTPYHGYLKNLALSLFGKWDKHFTAHWHGGHIKFWSRNTLSRLLEGAGFETVAFHGVGRVPYLWKSMILVARLTQPAMAVGPQSIPRADHG